MQDFLVEAHTIFRWVVLIAAVAALVLAVMSATGSRPWDAVSDRASLFFTIAMDIQLLIGLLVWVVEQRWGGGDNYLSFLHPLLMIAAVGLAHVGRVRADRAQGDRSRGTTAALFFSASLVVIVLAIPFGAWPL
jgi:hypothetical protein